MKLVEGKVAFTIGAGAGIGRATAQMFASEGARAVIAELDAESGRSNENAIRDAGGYAIFVETGVTRENSVRDAIHNAPGTPQDVANIVLLLASDKSRFINGTTIPADGGRLAYL